MNYLANDEIEVSSHDDPQTSAVITNATLRFCCTQEESEDDDFDPENGPPEDDDVDEESDEEDEPNAPRGEKRKLDAGDDDA